MTDASFKVCIFGDGGVGKTTLINKYVTGVFQEDTTMTIGVDFHVKKLNIDSIAVALQIWDFAGEDRFRFLLPSYVKGASGGIFMYDITRFSSFRSFNDWLQVLRDGTKVPGDEKNLPLLMIGSKLDLEFKRAVSREAAIDLARLHNFYGFVECSAKTGQNVETIFEALTKVMLKRANML